MCKHGSSRKSADIKHLGAATAVCVYTDGWSVFVSVCEVLPSLCPGFLEEGSVQYIAEIRAFRGFRAESLEDPVRAKKVKSLG